jgi:hypothetical protein
MDVAVRRRKRTGREDVMPVVSIDLTASSLSGVRSHSYLRLLALGASARYGERECCVSYLPGRSYRTIPYASAASPLTESDIRHLVHAHTRSIQAEDEVPRRYRHRRDDLQCKEEQRAVAQFGAGVLCSIDETRLTPPAGAMRAVSVPGGAPIRARQIRTRLSCQLPFASQMIQHVVPDPASTGAASLILTRSRPRISD